MSNTLHMGNMMMMMMMMMMNFSVVWLTDEMDLALFLVGTIFRDSHHRRYPTRREQDFNLRRT